jgi:hypothetical protein
VDPRAGLDDVEKRKFSFQMVHPAYTSFDTSLRENKLHSHKNDSKNRRKGENEKT